MLRLQIRLYIWFYIIIGNFYDNAHTDTAHVTGYAPYNAAYYFIDDVSLVDCTTVGFVREEKEEGKIKVFPNPATISLTISLAKGEGNIGIYNVVGEKVYSSIITNTKIEIDIGGFAKGMYFVEVRNSRGMQRWKFIKQ